MSSIYEVLRRPIVTEKTNYLVNKLHQYVFEVANDANRTLVKDAVEMIFDVEVVRVNIMNMPAKMKRKGRGRRMAISKSQYKKALVTLKAEDRISIFEGVE